MRAFVLLLSLPVCAAVVSDVRYKISAGDLTSADAIADEFCRTSGPTPECADAIAWLARGAFYMKDYPAAARYLAKTKSLTDQLLKQSHAGDDAFLTAAIGAQIEVQARMLAAQGKRDEAIAFLRSELPKWPAYALHARIQKNLNLLTLVGQPAPHLDPDDPGHVVLLFLWGHWCSDCSGQAPILARIHKRYPSVTIRAITRRIGYARDIENPTPAQEDADRQRVWKETYTGLEDVAHPVDEAATLDYGASSTPTFVLIDRRGIVRFYKPYRLSEEALAREIERVEKVR
jgi:thiol-disulfide isomerase/thioredoxin